MRKRKLLPPLLVASALSAGAALHSGEPQAPDSLFLSLIQTVATKEDKAPAELPLGALDFLSSVYEEADYYSTGLCDSSYQPKNHNSRIYVDGLPPRVIQEFRRPVSGRITSPFGLRDKGNRMHKGVDIALMAGDSIQSAIGGTVARVGYEKGGYGHFIIIEHPDGVQSRYAHLQRALVKPGDEVMPGLIIALGGASGNCTGPHLHFEIRCCGIPADPTPLLMRKIMGKAK